MRGKDVAYGNNHARYVYVFTLISEMCHTIKAAGFVHFSTFLYYTRHVAGTCITAKYLHTRCYAISFIN